MNKLIIIVLCAIFALANGLETFNADNVDNYLNSNRKTIVDTLDNLLTRMQHSKENYLGSTQSVAVYRDFLVETIVQMDERLSPLQVLNDEHRACYQRHAPAMRNVTYTTDKIEICISSAIGSLEEMLAPAKRIYDALKSQYETEFENGIKTCNYGQTTQSNEYTNCVRNVVKNFTEFRVHSKREFEYAMDKFECDAKANIKRAIDCNFGVQTDVLTKNSVAELKMNRCISRQEECPPCEANSCDVVVPVQADYESTTIANPFLTHEAKRGCLLLSFNNAPH